MPTTKKEKLTKLGNISLDKKTRFIREKVDLDRIIARIEYLEAEIADLVSDRDTLIKNHFDNAQALHAAAEDYTIFTTSIGHLADEAFWLRSLLKAAHGHWSPIHSSEVKEIQHAEKAKITDMYTGEKRAKR